MTQQATFRVPSFGFGQLPDPKGFLDVFVIHIEADGVTRTLLRSDGVSWLAGTAGASALAQLSDIGSYNLLLNGPLNTALATKAGLQAGALASDTTKAPNAKAVVDAIAGISAGGGAALQSGALTGDPTKAPNAQAVVDAIAASSGGTPITVAYTTTIPLDTVGAGKKSLEHVVAANTTISVASGPVEGGNYTACYTGNGANTLGFSGITVDVAFDNTNGLQNIYAFIYQYGAAYGYKQVGSSVDVTPPGLVSALVADTDATKITLTWSEPMSATISAAAAFAVAGHTLTAHTYVDPTHTYLTTSTPFVTGESSRTVAYTQPGSNKMQDLAGNLLPNTSGVSITNSVATPTLVSAVVSNSAQGEILLTWSKVMSSTIPAVTAFAVSAGHTLTAHITVGPTTTKLTTTTNFTSGEAARTLAYTVPGSNQMKDGSGNLVQAITAAPITNNVLGLPTITSVVVQNTAPTILEVTLSEAYAGSLPALSAFAVNSGHALTAIAAGSTSSKINLTTSTAFAAGETKTLAYTKPGTNNITGATSGNELATVSGVAITDNVTAGGRADSFNRANEAPINIPSDGGTAWQPADSSLSGYQRAQVVSNRADAHSGFHNAFELLACAGADGTVQGDVVVNGASGRAGIAARVSSFTDFGAVFWYDKWNSEYQLQKRTAGAWAQLGAPVSASLTVGTYTLSLVLSGNSIIAKNGSTTIFTVTSSAFNSTTNHGFYMESGGGSDIEIDNWSFA